MGLLDKVSTGKVVTKVKPSWMEEDDEGEAAPIETSSGDSEARIAAAEDAIAAMKSGDAVALDRALYAHFMACEAVPHDEAE
jgi:hypothetical protein